MQAVEGGLSPRPYGGRAGCAAPPPAHPCPSPAQARGQLPDMQAGARQRGWHWQQQLPRSPVPQGDVTPVPSQEGGDAPGGTLPSLKETLGMSRRREPLPAPTASTSSTSFLGASAGRKNSVCAGRASRAVACWSASRAEGGKGREGAAAGRLSHLLALAAHAAAGANL